MSLNFQRSLPIQANVERFVRPSHVEDGHLVGHVWNTELGREVLVRAFVPKAWMRMRRSRRQRPALWCLTAACAG
jgi:hypothetical protein